MQKRGRNNMELKKLLEVLAFPSFGDEESDIAVEARYLWSAYQDGGEDKVHRLLDGGGFKYFQSVREEPSVTTEKPKQRCARCFGRGIVPSDDTDGYISSFEWQCVFKQCPLCKGVK